MKNLLELTVRDLMQRNIATVPSGMPLRDALHIMEEKNLSTLIVAPDHERDAHGILTRKDIVMEAIENWDTMWTLKTADLATKPLIGVPAHVGIKHAGRLMRLTGVRRLAVYEGAELVGMLSNTDLFKAIQRCARE